MPGEVILTIKNRHTPMCGTPPTLEQSPQAWLSYFENEHGEQWLFRCDRGTKAWQVWGGDLDWDTVIDSTEPLSQVTLGAAERLWLLACFEACRLREARAEMWGVWEEHDKQLRKAMDHG